MPPRDPHEFLARRDEFLADVYRMAGRLRLRRLLGVGMTALLVVVALLGVVVVRSQSQREGISVAANGPGAPTASGPITATTLAPTATTQAPPGYTEGAVVPTTSPPSVPTSAPSTTTGPTPSTFPPTSLLEATTTTTRSTPPEQPASRLTLEPGLWRLRTVSSDGLTLTIAVLEEGCVTFDHIEVGEESERVTVAAIVRRVTSLDPNVGCGDLRSVHLATVPLSSALGNRQLIGQCVPGQGSLIARQCASLQ